MVTFGVSPLVNRISDQKTDIVRVKNTIERGQQITANDLEIVRVGSYNLPDGVIKDGKSVVGKYATATLFAGDYLFSEKITGESNSAADILAALDGKKVAISVSIGSYADGLSGKLENGDIISIIIYNKEEYRSYIPAELDSLSGRMAQQLYQKQNITVGGFEETLFPDSFFDVAIGNVPFGQFKVVDKKYDKYNFLIHDYFFAKALDILPAKQHNEPSGNNGNGRKPH